MQKFETVLCPELGNVHQIDEYYGAFSEALQNIRMYGLTDKYGEKSLAQRFYNGLPRPKFTCLQDTPRDAGFTVGKCNREKEMWYWQIHTVHAPSAQSRNPNPHL